MGGEYAPDGGKAAGPYGSSPRGRGIPQSDRADLGGLRLIPAWAGNTGSMSTIRLIPAAHPRVGGEYVEILTLDREADGSSPRGRGIPELGRRRVSVRGLIPAWAGNTWVPSSWVLSCWAHPRVGGEYLALPENSSRPFGSSPRGRGIPTTNAVQMRIVRLIPAWAGNTRGMCGRHRARAAHPRVGGEYSGI